MSFWTLHLIVLFFLSELSLCSEKTETSRYMVHIYLGFPGCEDLLLQLVGEGNTERMKHISFVMDFMKREMDK